MAITNNGTVNSLTVNQIPSGYTRPTVTQFTDFEYKRTLDLTVLKSTVENVSASVTMTNIIGNGSVGITKQVTDILAGDYLASATVTAYADWIGLSNNYSNLDANGDFLKSTANSYQCEVILYVKTS